MEPRQLHQIKQAISAAGAAQVLDLETFIHELVSQQIAEFALARRTNLTLQTRVCPHCRTRGAVLHGKDKNGRQRFRCVNPECRRTYNILTGTPMARARKPEKWGTYLSHMTDHQSIRKIVQDGIGVNHVTVWRWRHRFLKAAANDNASILSGVIEADETFFVRSFKGERGWKNRNPPADRAARPRAWGATKRGLSDEQVPVLTALDSGRSIFDAILSSRADIETALNGRIEAGSILCSDGAAAYEAVAEKAGAEHRRIIVPTITPYSVKIDPVPTTPRETGRLGLGRVNAHHGRLKVFINGRCRGVATKYLGNYLGWNRAMRRDSLEGKALLHLALVEKWLV
jgi:transposase-like protein